MATNKPHAKNKSIRHKEEKSMAKAKKKPAASSPQEPAEPNQDHSGQPAPHLADGFVESLPPYVVALGASAGGLEALQTFFSCMPADSGLAFVVIQHLSPDFKSLMDELLSRHTSMAIHRVENGMKVEPNSVYLIPPKKDMTLSQGALLLADRAIARPLDLPIDIFFRSLAQDSGDRAVAVVLSGTGSDGSRGVRAIREANGLVIVQSPESAKFDGMPRSAIAAGAADLVLPPEAMPDMIQQYAQDPLSVRGGDEAELLKVMQDDDGTAAVFLLLKRHYGIDFNHYKPTTVGRRLARRMAIRQINSLSDYLSYLSTTPEELNALYKDLLIGVTSFFRDAEAFQRLEAQVLPEVFRAAEKQQEVRAWVAGCATGEEAYSVAMLLIEGAEKTGFHGKISVFATDAHKGSLEYASAGVYEQSRLINVPQARRARFFKEEREGEMRVVSELRSRIVFAQHNVISDPPFTKMDLVTCRNMLIYLHPGAQDKALSMFHFALKVGRVLFLGSSESTGSFVEEFDVIDNKTKLFRKIREVKLSLDFNITRREERERPSAVLQVRGLGEERKLLQDYDRLLKKYMPPGLLLNERREVVHVFGDGARYLTNLEGRTGRDVLEMVEGNLRLALGAALQRASGGTEPVIFKNLSPGIKDGPDKINLAVEGLVDERTKTSRFHVAFHPVDVIQHKHDPKVSKDDENFVMSNAARRRIDELDSELQSTRENLQSTIEELQTTNEELQATNEEMLASNEELQSTNEELHSVNEELYTVNAEFEKKNKELQELNDDYDNLLRSTEVGTLFLDNELRIRRFNPAIKLTFNLLPLDIGRPVEHITYRLEGQRDMIADLKAVLKSGKALEKEVRTADGTWLLKRVLPFITAKGIQDGVVLTFTDITHVKQIELEQQRLDILRDLAANVPGVVFQYVQDGSHGGHFTFISEGSHDLLGIHPPDLLDDPGSLLRILHPEETPMLRERVKTALEENRLFDVEHRVMFPDGNVRFIQTRCSPRITHDGTVIWHGVCFDIDRRKKAEIRLKKAADYYLSILNSAPALIWRSDTQGDCDWFNETWLAFTGRSMQQEMGNGWASGVHPQDMERCLSIFKEAFAEQRQFHMDYRLRRADGEYRWITDHGTPLVNLDGEFVGFIGFCFDITDRIEAAENMGRAVDMMANANKIKSEFLANMSHEIRTPLNGILGMLQLMEMTRIDSEQAEYIETAIQSGQHLLALINEILDLSKVEAGKLEISSEEFDLRELLDLNLKTFLPLAREKNIILHLNVKLPENPRFIGDGSRISQVFLNVLGNAVKFTLRGEVRVQVSVELEPNRPTMRRINFSVRDTGVGIPSQDIDRIFEPFVQVDGSPRRTFSGTGLGLAIAKRLTNLMGGGITIESTEGVGTEVLFSAMVKTASNILDIASSQNSDERDTEPGLSMLVVEDDPTTQKFMKIMLEKNGHASVVVDGQDDIVQLLSKNAFDVILMDIQLTGNTGIEITESIRAAKDLGEKSRIPIIALTAHAMKGDREKFLASGIDDYISKPVDFHELFATITRVISSKRDHHKPAIKRQYGDNAGEN
jgi:two-component system CheB/CheR fusion protein